MAQLAEWSVPKHEVQRSNTVLRNYFYIEQLFTIIVEGKNKEERDQECFIFRYRMTSESTYGALFLKVSFIGYISWNHFVRGFDF